MDMKNLFVLFFVCLSAHHITGDRLDHLDDQLDHHDDFHDHLEDLFDSKDHDDDFSHEDILEKQLLSRIEQFLPNEQPSQFVDVSQTNPTNLEKNLGFGIPLIPANDQPSNDITIQTNNHQIQHSLSAPSPPQIQPELPRETFGVPLQQTIVEQPKQSEGSPPQRSEFSFPQHSGDSVSQHSGDIIKQNQLAPLNKLVEQPVVIVSDSAEDYDVDIPVLVDPAPLGIDPAHQDYDDIHNNEIGGQGRQLDEGHPSFAPNFDPFEGNYPRYALVPRTSFSCGDHQFGGYYADTEADCQVFHICLDGGLMGSFLCPNGTLFNQPLFVCDWWFNVDCSLSSQSYQLNARIGVEDDSGEKF